MTCCNYLRRRLGFLQPNHHPNDDSNYRKNNADKNALVLSYVYQQHGGLLYVAVSLFYIIARLVDLVLDLIEQLPMCLRDDGEV